MRTPPRPGLWYRCYHRRFHRRRLQRCHHHHRHSCQNQPSLPHIQLGMCMMLHSTKWSACCCVADGGACSRLRPNRRGGLLTLAVFKHDAHFITRTLPPSANDSWVCPMVRKAAAILFCASCFGGARCQLLAIGSASTLYSRWTMTTSRLMRS